jgi:hypothetical protein
MALFSQKTMQFVRAPDENVFIAPFNLIEIFCLILPLEWWMSKAWYERINDIVMSTIYGPLLLITAWLETRSAHIVKRNRRRGEEDDDTIEEWEEMDASLDFEGEGWAKKVDVAKPNVEKDATLVEICEVKDMVGLLRKELEGLQKAQNGGGSGGPS